MSNIVNGAMASGRASRCRFRALGINAEHRSWGAGMKRSLPNLVHEGLALRPGRARADRDLWCFRVCHFHGMFVFAAALQPEIPVA